MIQNEKMIPAIRAIHELILQARFMAADSKNKSLYEFLDQVEYLPALILEKNDVTDIFEYHLKDMCEESGLSFIFEKYQETI